MNTSTNYNTSEDYNGYQQHPSQDYNGSLVTEQILSDAIITPGLFEREQKMVISMIVLYCIIFVIGVAGNTAVLYIVIRNKSMQTITNIFIACLSASDLLICLFAVPFTPIRSLANSWLFGEPMCKLVAVVLVIAVFASTLTSVAIAIDRFQVIVFPHAKRMSARMQVVVILSIWLMAATASTPSGVFISVEKYETTESEMLFACKETWPNAISLIVYGWTIFILQNIIPAFIIAVCYTTISFQLNRRLKKKFGNSIRDGKRERQEILRNRRINRMLIAMIVVFAVCWLPMNIIFITYKWIPQEKFVTVFLFAHIFAMSSVIYNPFIYGWMNENFNQHFRQMGSSMLQCCCKAKTTDTTSISEDGSGVREKRKCTNICVKQSPMQRSPATSVLELRAGGPDSSSQVHERRPFLLPTDANKLHLYTEKEVSQNLLKAPDAQDETAEVQHG